MHTKLESFQVPTLHPGGQERALSSLKCPEGELGRQQSRKDTTSTIILFHSDFCGDFFLKAWFIFLILACGLMHWENSRHALVHDSVLCVSAAIQGSAFGGKAACELPEPKDTRWARRTTSYKGWVSCAGIAALLALSTSAHCTSTNSTRKLRAGRSLSFY